MEKVIKNIESSPNRLISSGDYAVITSFLKENGVKPSCGCSNSFRRKDFAMAKSIFLKKKSF